MRVDQRWLILYWSKNNHLHDNNYSVDVDKLALHRRLIADFAVCGGVRNLPYAALIQRVLFQGVPSLIRLFGRVTASLVEVYKLMPCRVKPECHPKIMWSCSDLGRSLPAADDEPNFPPMFFIGSDTLELGGLVLNQAGRQNKTIRLGC